MLLFLIRRYLGVKRGLSTWNRLPRVKDQMLIRESIAESHAHEDVPIFC